MVFALPPVVRGGQAAPVEQAGERVVLQLPNGAGERRRSLRVAGTAANLPSRKTTTQLAIMGMNSDT
ncbi:hypothetical protein ACFQY4_18175 [Catellatospora bangladeshensis]|uniref:hypothetical protein n=1 Tax=Catellatospora bangladeshensis TaxID=310355 RepID=UPI00360B2554